MAICCNLLNVIILGITLVNANTESDAVESLKDKLEKLEESSNEQGTRSFVVQGDILLTRDEARKLINGVDKESNRHKRQAQRRNASNENLWIDGVKYLFDVKASQQLKDGFTRAVKAWEKDTCINFTLVETMKEVEGQDYLYVTYDDTDEEGCLSHVGKLGGYQPIYLGKGCESFPHAAHELGHALGMYHTQTRHDRDQYIRLQEDNLQGYADQFKKLTEDQNENYGLPYDYGSIMHYGSSIEKPWMVPVDPNYKTTMGSPFISFIDLYMMNKHYNCTDICDPETSAKCENGGFPHPRRCYECICPGGYGGPLCNQLPQDCKQGRKIAANAFWEDFQEAFQNTKKDGSYATCTYWITAPDNKKIEINLLSVYTKATIGCAKGGVEIKANANHTLTGYRYVT
ncbi:astacin [Ancylostoma duodenale]|uniref:Zinc metalloproteinase n=1 Tax=Ancylostoma duodenale TaxID=51022 RepID=A0A0C2D2G5_9BILA|nr:astacin [Ancylostoma duodenale]